MIKIELKITHETPPLSLSDLQGEVLVSIHQDGITLPPDKYSKIYELVKAVKSELNVG